ncbi:Calmodulin [Durusdinium trenchii]|uniref:Calmodulin n=1 Tax=Durusdinium trenchii TaxID=1381693 RepID=A0ABP0KMP6_9DINO
MGLLDALRGLGARHEALKKKIHSTRIPLSKNGQRVMMMVYITVPVVAGYFVMEWSNSFAASKWQVNTREDGTVTYKVPREVAARGIEGTHEAHRAQAEAIQRQLDRVKGNA